MAPAFPSWEGRDRAKKLGRPTLRRRWRETRGGTRADKGSGSLLAILKLLGLLTIAPAKVRWTS